MFSPELESAISVAWEAGAKVLEIYRGGDFGTKTKDDSSPITLADTAANEIIMQKLKGHIISEEIENPVITDAPTWVIDPMDGTKGFVKRTDDFSVIIGMIKEKKPVLGVVYLPVDDITYAAEKDGGAWMHKNDKWYQITVSDRRIPDLRLVTSREHFTSKDEEFSALVSPASLVKVGSTGIKLSKIAEAEADLFYCLEGRSIWDICGPQAILEEAGGEVLGTDGELLAYDQLRFRTGIVATNKACSAEVLSLLKKFEAR
jgi:3'(2'), 5'-bisphosphate nucleotidase